MSKSNEDFKPEIGEAECQQDFCDCSHCQEAEEEYHQELEDEYQEDILSDGDAEIENSRRISDRWKEEEARQIEKDKHEKSLLEKEISDCLMRYAELGGNPTDIEMIRICICNFVISELNPFDESNIF